MVNCISSGKSHWIITIITVIVIFSSLLLTCFYIESSNINDSVKKVITDLDENEQDIHLQKDKLKNLSLRLFKSNRESEYYFIKGYIDVIDENVESAKNNFIMSIDKMKKDTTSFVKFYSGKMVCDLLEKEGNSNDGIKHVEVCLSKMEAKDYNKEYKHLWMLINSVIKSQDSRNMIIEKLESNIQDTKISGEARLYMMQKLKRLYTMNYNYAKASEYIIKSIYLSKNLNVNEIEARSIVELGIIFREIENREIAIYIIENASKVYIEDLQQRSLMEAYIAINLSEIYIEIGEFDKAKGEISKVPFYESYINEEDYRDMEIFYRIIYTYILLNEGNIGQAKDNLDVADKLFEMDKDEFLVDKELLYLMAKAEYFEYNREYDLAIETYKNLILMCEESNDIYNKRRVIKDLTNIAINYESDNLDKEYDEYINGVITLIRDNQISIYKDYSYFIVENVKNQIELDNQRSKIQFFIRIVTFSLICISIFFIIVFTRIKRLKRLNKVDGLTQVYNRAYFNKKYREITKENNDFAIIMMDVDNFKILNDTYGHKIGDNVLMTICNTIDKLLYNDYYLYRYGGEEFVVVGVYRTKEEVTLLAERIRKEVENIIWENDINVTLSLGIAYSSTNCKYDVLEAADKNLYKAKKSGKNKIVV